MNNKPWSISTTVRNPTRLRDFLQLLKQLEGKIWDSKTQVKYQILLIQNRLYGYGSQQFYKNLSANQIDLIEDSSKKMSFSHAEKIFKLKKYNDPPHRGRQSFNPLKKLGLVKIEKGKIKITEQGNLLLKDSNNLAEVLFYSLLKWQKFEVKPLVATFHLIYKVNELEKAKGRKPKGISIDEFNLYVPTLINYRDIKSYANQIIKLRNNLQGNKNNYDTIFGQNSYNFCKHFLSPTGANATEITKLESNLVDYGDNARRYFRATGYIHFRGDSRYVDLEPTRMIEIESILNSDNAKPPYFKNQDDYLSYIADPKGLLPPWKNKTEYSKIIKHILKDIKSFELVLNIPQSKFKESDNMSLDELETHIEKLRSKRHELQDKIDLERSQDISEIKDNIKSLETIHSIKNSSLMLEKISTFCLMALNDAENIRPNYPIGDDNEPLSHAPGGVADIECFYLNFNSICEVTMLTDRRQWYHEGQPVMRHLRDFEDQHGGKPAYCVFIAPKLHRDTINTYWQAIKTGYEGKKQFIIPLSIHNFIKIMNTFVMLKSKNIFLSHNDLSQLFDKVLCSVDQYDNSQKWISSIEIAIEDWAKALNK